MPLPLMSIVDDNPESLIVIGEWLQPEHAARVANSGLRALRPAQQKPQPDLMLFDVTMPEMDDHEVLHQLCEQPGTAASR